MSDTFQPPRVDQVEALLERHPLRHPSALSLWGPLIALGLLLAVVLVAPDPWGVVLPWLGLAGAVGWLVLRVRRARRVDEQVTRAQELAMLRHHERALAMGWRVLPATETSPGPYLRTLTLLAHCLEEVGAYEAAIACFDRLLEMLPHEHPGTAQLSIHRAIAALGAQRLVDADEALRRWRHVPRERAGSPLAAMYRLAELIQIVRTGHYSEALRHEPELLEELRPLGVEAGYGHALLALCCQHARPEDEDARLDLGRRAAMWWQRATLLLPGRTLVERFPELAAMTAMTQRDAGEEGG